MFGCNCWATGWQSCTSSNNYCRTCTKDYPKPLGTGSDRVPPSAVSWGDRVIPPTASLEAAACTCKLPHAHMSAECPQRSLAAHLSLPIMLLCPQAHG